jgi:Type VI secretion system (T6SS), amidase effector protein 4
MAVFTLPKLRQNNGQWTAFQIMWNQHHGKDSFYPAAGDHQCSINMSAAFQDNNVDMSSYNKSYFPYTYNGKNYRLARDVNQLSYWVLRNINNIVYPLDLLGQYHLINPNWTHKRLGDSYNVKGGSSDGYFYDAENLVSGKKGVIILWECWLLRDKNPKGDFKPATMASPIRGHIDLVDGTLNPQQMKRAGAKNGEKSD